MKLRTWFNNWYLIRILALPPSGMFNCLAKGVVNESVPTLNKYRYCYNKKRSCYIYKHIKPKSTIIDPSFIRKCINTAKENLTRVNWILYLHIVFFNSAIGKEIFCSQCHVFLNWGLLSSDFEMKSYFRHKLNVFKF